MAMADENPITDSDFEQAFVLEANKDASDGWSLYAKGERYESWVRKRPGESLNLIRHTYELTGTTAEQLTELLKDPTAFDKNYKEFKVVKECDGYSICRTLISMSAIPLVSEREFVSAISVRTISDAIVTIAKAHPTDLVPVTSRYVRGEPMVFVTIVREKDGVVTFCSLYKTDYKGSIPYSMVNSTSAGLAPGYVKMLQRYIDKKAQG
ncbi:uncharacterized protein LOC135829507 [Sycon ciliatum]|uniref:uncharacterized protein LOC135829507 n=1 Tax=Sycon ciliatum TaxID=27933 RepID=UPI0031F616BA